MKRKEFKKVLNSHLETSAANQKVRMQNRTPDTSTLQRRAWKEYRKKLEKWEGEGNNYYAKYGTYSMYLQSKPQHPTFPEPQ
jgi:hypothetical protein